MTEEEQKSIKEEIGDIKALLADKKTRKKFHLPLSIKLRQGQLIRKEWCIVLFIRTNGSIQIKMFKIEDDTVKIGDTFYSASADYIMRYKRFPLLIIHESNMEPYKPAKHAVDAIKSGTLTSAQRTIAVKMEKESIKPKGNFSIKGLIIVVVVGAVGYFILQSMGFL